MVVKLAVRDFAMPSPRRGSIDATASYNLLPGGQELHLQVQKARRAASPSYRTEQKLSHSYFKEEFQFKVSGRIDGLFDGNPPVIEEIKSTKGRTGLLKDRLIEQTDHPYILQTKTYGHMYYETFGSWPRLQLFLISSNVPSDYDTLEIRMDIDEYLKWLERRLTELVEETRYRLANLQRRRETAGNLLFPFSHSRPGQKEMIDWISDQAQQGSSRMLIQAPTGLGKTVGVMFPLLKDAMKRGQKLVYVTAKNSQHAVAEDALNRMRQCGSDIRSTTLTAKAKVCFKEEPQCTPEYCEFAKDYYEKVHSNRLLTRLDSHAHLSADTFAQVGLECTVCPFELAVDTLQHRDVVICDYNYVFSPRSLLGAFTAESSFSGQKPNLIIDEAHNLPSRACGYYSPELNSSDLKDAICRSRALPAGYAIEGEAAFNRALHLMETSATAAVKEAAVSPDARAFAAVDSTLKDFAMRYLLSGLEIGKRDPVLAASRSWAKFSEALADSGEQFFTTFQRDDDASLRLKITCCDASKFMKEAYKEFAQVAAFSATVKPFSYYAQLSGLADEQVATAEFRSPFPGEHRKIIAIPRISTKYSERQRNYSKIAQAVEKITALKRGNYFVFFPAFQFLEAVVKLTAPNGFKIKAQRPSMKIEEISDWVASLKQTNEPTIIFAVQGGVFAEGIDYPGDSVIGAIIVGPALPAYNLERELIRKYYDRRYGAGFDYAYTFPAMTRVVQSAGRVIRSQTDRGLIVLMDKRFLDDSYSSAMPDDWFNSSARELVSNSILKDVSDFWCNI